jgi:hypothetical protein
MTPPRHRSVLVAWLLTTCAAGVLVGPARAAVLCARASHGATAPNDGATVKVRGACKPNEATLDPAALGIATGLATTVVRTGNQVSTNGALSTSAFCAAGEVATGGGALATGTNDGVAALRSSRPQPDDADATPTGWRVTVANQADKGTITATAYVVCAVPAP